jgi:hypothetical protein
MVSATLRPVKVAPYGRVWSQLGFRALLWWVTFVLSSVVGHGKLAVFA